MRVTIALLTGLTAALAGTVLSGGYRSDPAGLAWWYILCWALFAAAVLALRRVPAERAGRLVLLGGAAVVLTGLAAPPTTSTDSYRYAWDGRVQAAGISPYDHAPADPALAKLRDRWLFPGGAACAGPDKPAVTPGGTCTRINRPQVHTIYPPVAEAYFLLVHRLAPDGSRHKPLQVGGAICAFGTTVLLLMLLRRRGLDPRHAALWAWCPAVPVEAVNNAHVDGLAVLLTVAALYTWRGKVGGVLFGLAIAAKFLPALLLPAVLPGNWRRAWPIPLVVAGVYLPYVLVSHSSVLGYLGGYAHEEGYGDPGTNGRYLLLRLVMPDSWAPVGVAVGLAAVAVYALRRGESAALPLTGTAFLLLTPGYSWYALLLVALAAIAGRPEWLAVALAGQITYLVGQTATWAYALAALTVLFATVARSSGVRGWIAPQATKPVALER